MFEHRIEKEFFEKQNKKNLENLFVSYCLLETKWMFMVDNGAWLFGLIIEVVWTCIIAILLWKTC